MPATKRGKIFRAIAVWVIATLLLVSTLGIHSFAEDTDTPEEGEGSSETTPGGDNPTADPDAEKQLVAEDGDLALYMNMTTADFYILNKKTDEKYYSTIPDISTEVVANDEVKANMQSIVAISYYDSKNAIHSMNTFTDCLPHNQVTITKIDKGVKVLFVLGQQDTRRVIPQAMRQEEFEKYLAQMEKSDATLVKTAYKLYDAEEFEKSTQKEELLESYPHIQDTPQYILRSGTAKRKLNQVEEIFQGLGLTKDDIQAENELLEVNVEGDNKPVFQIPVTFQLVDGDLVAEIQSEEIVIPENYNLYNITLLEYFGAAAKDTEGYFLVPDGSGALINFDPQRSVKSYIQSLYGKDATIIEKEKTFYGQNAHLPVFGMKTGTGGMFAIIESGDALASVNAYISGLNSSYYNIYPRFNVSPTTYMTYEGNSMQASGVYLFPQDISRVNIRVRYKVLDESNNTYVGMAKLYRSYLEDNGILKKLDNDVSKVPFFMEMQGFIEKRKMFFGIGYDSTQPLTTFEQAQQIYQEATEKGIDQITMKYVAWANGGFYNTVNNKVKIESILGGKKGFNELNDFLKKQGSQLFADVDFQYVGQDKWFDGFSSRKDSSMTMERKIATLMPYDPASFMRYTNADYGRYVFSPKNLLKTIESYLNSFKAYNTGAISVGTLGSDLNADYNCKNVIDRNTAEQIVMDGLAQMQSGDYQIMVNGGNAYTLKYATDILNMPLTSSSLNIEDEMVPFFQIVVHGYVQFAGEAINTSLNQVQTLLKSVETGAGLYYKWMYEPDDVLKETKYENTMYSLNYNTWIDDAAETYKSVNAVLAGTQNAVIEDHQKLQENVYKTVFSNGTAVIVNYNRYDVTVEGTKVGAENFAAVGGAR